VLDELIAEAVEGALEVLAASQERGEVALVAEEVGAGGFALDEDGGW
jgi:hypothetical protein